MALEVELESVGNRTFDLDHLRREGAVDLVRLLLQEAGYKEHLWRLRVENKYACGAETRPVTLMWAKPWGCYLKIKPGDNNTGHFCCLMMPPGMRGEEVHEALKRVEQRFDRNWRHGLKEAPDPAPQVASPAPAPIPAAEAAPPEMAAAPVGSKIKEWRSDPEKIQLLLIAIEEMETAGPWASKPEYSQSLSERMGWGAATGHEVGGLFTSLVRQEYIRAVGKGSKDIGYLLTEKGRRLIGPAPASSTLPAPPTAPPAAAPPVPAHAPSSVPNAIDLLLEYAPLAQRFADVSQQLKANRDRRAELAAEMALLDHEAEELTRFLSQGELSALLQRQLELTQGLEMPPRGTAGPLP